MTLTVNQTVPIGKGADGKDRGRLAPDAAASIGRLDKALGRPADINSAWRNPAAQQILYDNWTAYWRDPVAWRKAHPGQNPPPRALPPDQSIHCQGYAADSDDWYNAAAAAKWRDHGWLQTARSVNPALDEPWHGEYAKSRDKHLNDPAGGGSQPFPDPEEEKDSTMFILKSSATYYLADGGYTYKLQNSAELAEASKMVAANRDGAVLDGTADELALRLKILATGVAARPVSTDAPTTDEIWKARVQAIDNQGKPIPGVTYSTGGMLATVNGLVDGLAKNPATVSDEQIDKLVKDVVNGVLEGLPDGTPADPLVISAAVIAGIKGLTYTTTVD